MEREERKVRNASALMRAWRKWWWPDPMMILSFMGRSNDPRSTNAHHTGTIK